MVDPCVGNGNAHDDLSCVDRSLAESKQALNAIYRKFYASTQYKSDAHAIRLAACCR